MIYDFRCEKGHVTTRNMSMSSITPNITVDCDVCGMEASRLFTPIRNVIRPSGWNLKPEDKGYYDIPMERHPHIKNPREGV